MKPQSILAVLVWCVVAIIWNVAVFGTSVRAVINGNYLTLLIMIPFVLIGLVLLIVLYSSVRVGIESLLKIGTPKPPIITEVAKPPVLTESATPVESSDGISFKGSPVLGALAAIAFINWFVFFGVSMYLGGDAVGILPSKEGFVLKEHGRRIAVSEPVWVFSLYYSTASLLGTPAIIIPIGLLQLNKQKKNARPLAKILVGVFVSLWVVMWFSSIGSSFYRSYSDWQKLKQHEPEMLYQSPAAKVVTLIALIFANLICVNS
jgi:hypothetical protein